MRIFIGLIVVVAVIGGFVSHRKSEPPPVTIAPAPAAQASPARQNYEHDWAKNSLDRAAEVKKQVLQQRKDNGY